MQNLTHFDDCTRELRSGMDLPAFAYRKDDVRLPVVITDLSYDGCQICVQDQLTEGEAVVLIHSNLGEVTAEVRWVSATKAGLRFTRAGRAD